MLLFPFGSGSTKQQYMSPVVVPVGFGRVSKITVDDTVDKPVGYGRDSARLEKKEPHRTNVRRGSRASDPVIRVINKADAGTDARVRPGDMNRQFRSNAVRTHSLLLCS
jgi:hypothetical protein